jgi:hypothetical protein
MYSSPTSLSSSDRVAIWDGDVPTWKELERVATDQFDCTSLKHPPSDSKLDKTDIVKAALDVLLTSINVPFAQMLVAMPSKDKRQLFLQAGILTQDEIKQKLKPTLETALRRANKDCLQDSESIWQLRSATSPAMQTDSTLLHQDYMNVDTTSPTLATSSSEPFTERKQDTSASSSVLQGSIGLADTSTHAISRSLVLNMFAGNITLKPSHKRQGRKRKSAKQLTAALLELADTENQGKSDPDYVPSGEAAEEETDSKSSKSKKPRASSSLAYSTSEVRGADH